MKYLSKIRDLFCPKVWILEGNEKSTNKPLKVLFIGTEPNKNYINGIIFDNICNESYLGKKFFWYLYYLLGKNKYKCSLAIIDGIFIDRILYESKKNFYIPGWVEGIVRLPLVATTGSAKRDLQILRKNKVEYFVTKDTEMLHDFYYHMHMPMIRERHQNRALEWGYNRMMEKMKEECYELLLIKKQDMIISGVSLNRCGEVPRLWQNGIRDFKYAREGAIAATYVYSSQYLWEKGYKKVSFGTARSFLNDGVLQYKKKWNITLKSSVANKGERRGYIVKPLVASDAVKGFFMNNPFIYKKKNKLYGAVFVNEDEQCPDEDYKQWQKQYYLEGLSGLNIFSIKENKIIDKTTVTLKKTIHSPKKGI